ncbi:hypothetical protein K474DRAFT_1684543 [Panus rudis PR-1116 ss-1]|nr:hypothetical protein K474DRAFT_1684543 [Panus rudis PR-1116 ss-1]
MRRKKQHQNQGDGKDASAAEALSNLSQSGYNHQHPLPGQPLSMHSQFPVHPVHAAAAAAAAQHQHAMGEPGPSSHPRGPPNLGQLAATALQNGAPNGPPATSNVRTEIPDGPVAQSNDASGSQQGPGSPGQSGSEKGTPAKSSGGRRSGRSANMSNDEWARIRKDNHKEVERRRRGNINEGINELGRIVPNGSGEKAKGAILSRAVQYIHHLKENEARNIEKWTLEKLLMDQAMGDLQAQLDETRRAFAQEREHRMRLENELAMLRGETVNPAPPPAAPAADADNEVAESPAIPQLSPPDIPEGLRKESTSSKRSHDEVEGGDVDQSEEAAVEEHIDGAEGTDTEERAKRQRVE